MRFFASGLFNGSVSPQPQSIPLVPFQFFFLNSRRNSQVKVHHQYQDTAPVANFATSFTSVVDTGGKFATSVNNTGGKFATGVNDTGGKQWEQYQTADNLKGQCHEIFCLWFFSSISFPPAPEYPIRTVSNFFENSRRYSQLNIDQRCR